MPTFLRWLSVVPGAIIAMFLALFPLHLVLYQTFTGSGIVEPYPAAPERLLTPFVAALVFVWAGSRIAPNRKIETAVVLFGVMLLIIGASIALALTGERIGNLRYFLILGGIPSVGAIVGALIGLYIVWHENSEKHKSGLED